uniref:Uncharacterized protein n=1 Tax=Vitis vinifera TaxID=29760 RepID=A5BNJ2_VITVI|nr:hypothetical protein VITISV_014952 [Vitis vinifera]
MAFGRQLFQACAKFAQHLQLVRSLCETRTTLAQHLQLVQSLCKTRTTLAQHLPNSHSPCVLSYHESNQAPRRETGTSRAQGKRHVEPSQPEQTEAHRKARYDMTLFSSVDDYQRYKQKFAQRKVVPGRNINFSQLQHFEFEGLFSGMGWLPVVTIFKPIFPTLVRTFYSRATYGLGGPVLSTVRGVEIRLAWRVSAAFSTFLQLDSEFMRPRRGPLYQDSSLERLFKGGHRDEVSYLEVVIVDSILTGRRIHVRRAERQARGQGQMHPGVEKKAEIREMEDRLDPQRDFEQRGHELDIPPPPQSKGIHEHMDQYQTGVTSRFEHFQQRFEHIEERMDQQQATFEHLQ